jgi:hypothetical protein
MDFFFLPHPGLQFQILFCDRNEIQQNKQPATVEEEGEESEDEEVFQKFDIGTCIPEKFWGEITCQETKEHLVSQVKLSFDPLPFSLCLLRNSPVFVSDFSEIW